VEKQRDDLRVAKKAEWQEQGQLKRIVQGLRYKPKQIEAFNKDAT